MTWAVVGGFPLEDDSIFVGGCGDCVWDVVEAEIAGVLARGEVM